MAPFDRRRSIPHKRAPGRSRGVHRSAFRSRQKGSRNAKTGNPFYSTRVEEQTKDVLENSADSSADGSEEPELPPDTLSDNDEEESSKHTVKPYTALLQSLGTDRGETLPKKRRIETVESARETEVSAQDVKQDVDQVEEPEEVEDFGVDGAEDVDDLQEDYDPFMKHFAQLGDTDLLHRIQDVKNGNWIAKIWNLESEGGHLIKATQPSTSASGNVLSVAQDTDDLQLKQKLQVPAKRALPSLDRVNGSLASSIFNYGDVLFPQRNLANAEILRKLICLHALNHIFKTRDIVIKDNARLAKENNEDLELRDQGFTRPKVLVILPTRNSCVKYIDIFTSLCQPEQQENKKRFQESYASNDDNFSEDRPEDFRELFAGNDDDMFRLGLKMTRKTVKFFAQFYNSDIIFASPLGLRMAIGADDPKKQDHDFLSSIELVVVDQADAMLMQNWEHMEYTFEHLNLQPKEAHGCDFSRVRDWYLNGNARYLRQTILCSNYNFPQLNKFFNCHMLNVAGKTKYSKEEDGVLIDLGVPTRQIFSRLDVTNPVTEPDERFKYFTTAVLPSLIKQSKYHVGAGQGVLIYLPSYADFVRVRNHLANSSNTQDVSFGSISEYTSIRDVARARSHFFSGRHSVLLYTERAHHFRRYHLKGVKRIIMYGLPANPIFYEEIVAGYLAYSIASAGVNARETNVRSLFSKYDALKLERVVGTGRLAPMIKEKSGDTFEFL